VQERDAVVVAVFSLSEEVTSMEKYRPAPRATMPAQKRGHFLWLTRASRDSAFEEEDLDDGGVEEEGGGGVCLGR
jgi:ketosteroid isomerase-like protein